jgi:hypothetical protein
MEPSVSQILLSIRMKPCRDNPPNEIWNANNKIQQLSSLVQGTINNFKTKA